MNYNFSIPDIYNINPKNDNNLIKKTFYLTPNIYYDIIDENNYYDNIDKIPAIYFKTNTQKIEFYINSSKYKIHNNYLALSGVNNHRSGNRYSIINKDDIEQMIEVYIIFLNINLMTFPHQIYSKKSFNVCICEDICLCNNERTVNLFYKNIIYRKDKYTQNDNYSIFDKYNTHYYLSYNTYDIMLNFYVKSKNGNLEDIIKLNNNNIIFYFKYNYKTKFNKIGKYFN
jgi:hypothetical protein